MSSAPSEQDQHKRWRIVHEKSINKALAPLKINIRIRTDSTSGERRQQRHVWKGEEHTSEWNFWNIGCCIRLIVQHLLQFHLFSIYVVSHHLRPLPKEAYQYTSCLLYMCADIILVYLSSWPNTSGPLTSFHHCRSSVPMAATFHHWFRLLWRQNLRTLVVCQKKLTDNRCNQASFLAREYLFLRNILCKQVGLSYPVNQKSGSFRRTKIKRDWISAVTFLKPTL